MALRFGVTFFCVVACTACSPRAQLLLDHAYVIMNTGYESGAIAAGLPGVVVDSVNPLSDDDIEAALSRFGDTVPVVVSPFLAERIDLFAAPRPIYVIDPDPYTAAEDGDDSVVIIDTSRIKAFEGMAQLVGGYISSLTEESSSNGDIRVGGIWVTAGDQSDDEYDAFHALFDDDGIVVVERRFPYQASSSTIAEAARDMINEDLELLWVFAGPATYYALVELIHFDAAIVTESVVRTGAYADSLLWSIEVFPEDYVITILEDSGPVAEGRVVEHRGDRGLFIPELEDRSP